MWLFGWPSPWTDLLKVDILNAMGFALALMSVMALFRTVERVKLCAVLGLAIGFVSPVVSQIDWGWVPAALRAYIRARLSRLRIFPVAAYVGSG